MISDTCNSSHFNPRLCNGMWYVRPKSFSTTPIKTTNAGDAVSNLENKTAVLLLKIPHAAERSAFSFSAPLNRYMTVTTAFPPALTKRAADDPAAL